MFQSIKPNTWMGPEKKPLQTFGAHIVNTNHIAHTLPSLIFIQQTPLGKLPGGKQPTSNPESAKSPSPPFASALRVEKRSMRPRSIVSLCSQRKSEQEVSSQNCARKRQRETERDRERNREREREGKKGKEREGGRKGRHKTYSHSHPFPEHRPRSPHHDPQARNNNKPPRQERSLWWS